MIYKIIKIILLCSVVILVKKLYMMLPEFLPPGKDYIKKFEPRNISFISYEYDFK